MGVKGLLKLGARWAFVPSGQYDRRGIPDWYAVPRVGPFIRVIPQTVGIPQAGAASLAGSVAAPWPMSAIRSLTVYASTSRRLYVGIDLGDVRMPRTVKCAARGRREQRCLMRCCDLGITNAASSGSVFPYRGKGEEGSFPSDPGTE